ncbi:hypothetical protein [Massilia frigida]|uniref:hypothetical protein n=1 Tax=Massilia frigida TaxID=2609281 RepID=UPI001421714F|nr:hypothetical protein [Massilia frigida]
MRVVDAQAVSFHRTKYKLGHEHVPANRFDWDSATGRFVFRHPVLAKQRAMNALKLEQYQFDDLAAAKAVCA